MSGEKKKSKKATVLSVAAIAKNPMERVKELMTETKGDRKKAALIMQGEGYRVGEIEHAFKIKTGKGIGSQVWKKWKDEGKAIEEVGEVAGPVLAKEEKAWMTTVLAKFKTLTERLQTHVIDYGIYVLETVAPQVPADTPEEKPRKTKEFLRKAVDMVEPEKVEEIEHFGATAFLAACELKRQMAEFMQWADPSSRLQAMAEKCLYSPNPINKVAFDKLMTELIKSIHATPRFRGGPRVEELPGITKAYAQARGVPLEVAQERMQTALSEVGD